MKKLGAIGENIGRYGIVYMLLTFGIFKFTYTEAEAIKPLIDHSPILNWMTNVFSSRTVSMMIGIVEIIAAIGIALKFLSPRIAFYGSVLGSIIFFITLTFLFTTPGMITKVEWLWLPEGFLIKDVALLGFCVWSAGEAYASIKVNKGIK